ncbi:hypothetical protein B0H11DRAFT_1940811 [Mycena galericulata]|nr:hypothetical protein B0H11DRAFT_1940811 [Mycena galericulata]
MFEYHIRRKQIGKRGQNPNWARGNVTFSQPPITEIRLAASGMPTDPDYTNQGKCSKRSSGQAGLDGEGPRRSKRVKAREDGGGDAGNGRVPGQARHPCKRGGDDEREITQASRVNQIAASVAGMRRQLEEEEPEEHSDDEQGEGAFEEEEGAEQEQEGTKGKKGKKAGKRKKVKKKGVIWLIDGEPPVAKRNAALR